MSIPVDDDLESLLPVKEEGRIFCSCPFQKECWRDIRKPIIKAAAKEGIKVYLPYICSYQVMGDLSNCGHHENYVREKGDVLSDTS